MGHKKRAKCFILEYNFRVSWWISTLCVSTEKGINILHYGLVSGSLS